MDQLRRKAVLSAAALCIVSLMGCAESTDSGVPSADPGTFAWFDLGSDNPDAARDFYQGVFGWKFSRRSGGDYWTIDAGRTPIGGMFQTSGDGAPGEVFSQWIPVIGVQDAIQTTERAFSLGATQVSPIAQTEDGVYSSIYDPTGAPLDLYQGISGVPIADAGAIGTWIWADHFSPNPSRAGQFYTALLGWTSGRSDTGERVVRLNGNDLGGLVYLPKSEAEPNWLPYVAVSDLEATILKAGENGGRLLVREDGAAILIDPAGAAIGVIAVGG